MQAEKCVCARPSGVAGRAGCFENISKMFRRLSRLQAKMPLSYNYCKWLDSEHQRIKYGQHQEMPGLARQSLGKAWFVRPFFLVFHENVYQLPTKVHESGQTADEDTGTLARLCKRDNYI